MIYEYEKNNRLDFIAGDVMRAIKEELSRDEILHRILVNYNGLYDKYPIIDTLVLKLGSILDAMTSFYKDDLTYKLKKVAALICEYDLITKDNDGGSIRKILVNIPLCYQIIDDLKIKTDINNNLEVVFDLELDDDYNMVNYDVTQKGLNRFRVVLCRK